MEKLLEFYPLQQETIILLLLDPQKELDLETGNQT